MSECERLQPTFEAYVAGDLDESALGPLLAHCRGCDECRRLVELHRDLATLASRAPQPEEAELLAMESHVLDEIGRARREPGRRVVLPARSGWFRLPRLAAALAASLLLFAAGLGAGRLAWGGSGGDRSAALADRLIAAIRADAAGNQRLADVENSRFTYSDVSFRRAAEGRVALDFDLTTRVHLVEPAGSDLLQDVLVQSLLHPSSAGTRLKAMALAPPGMTPKTREALLFAMRRDESLAVRLGALTALSERLGDPEVEAAVLEALREDPSVQMRLLALDSLALHDVDRVRLREAIRKDPRPGNEALRVRLAEHEKRL